jgi:hypothetical protein
VDENDALEGVISAEFRVQVVGVGEALTESVAFSFWKEEVFRCSLQDSFSVGG